MYVAARPSTRAILEQATPLGLTFAGVADAAPADSLKLAPVRIALVDRPTGTAPSGWVRWLLERYEFPFEILSTSALEDGIGRFDILLLTDEVTVPRRSIPALKQFLEQGGTVLAIGDSTAVAYDLGLPIGDALVAENSEGRLHTLTSEMFFVPGSVLRVRVNNSTPLGYGFEPEVDVFFDSSPAFRIQPGERDVHRVAWYATETPLRSGWAWGQQRLKDAVAVLDAKIGKGRVLLFGPEVTYRAQPHGTFKFLFNGIYYSKAAAQN